MGDQQWNGPGEHGFTGVPDLLNSIGELDRFLTRKESLGILRNGALFAEQADGVLDAAGDRNRPDFDFVVVNRPTLVQVGHNEGMVNNKWKGYKRDRDEFSQERRISTLKVNENTFLWRHEVSGKRLLRRRISLDKDEGPFEDETQVYYILQYQKLPRMKKSKKEAILRKRAENGHY